MPLSPTLPVVITPGIPLLLMIKMYIFKKSIQRIDHQTMRLSCKLYLVHKLHTVCVFWCLYLFLVSYTSYCIVSYIRNTIAVCCMCMQRKCFFVYVLCLECKVEGVLEWSVREQMAVLPQSCLLWGEQCTSLSSD